MTLGELIDTLAALPATAEVRFDFGTVPTQFVSWRGDYAELSLDSAVGGAISVAALLVLAQKAVGGTFRGWKGGRYTMSRSTPVWADFWGDCHYGTITGLRVVEGAVEIVTFTLPPEYR